MATSDIPAANNSPIIPTPPIQSAPTHGMVSTKPNFLQNKRTLILLAVGAGIIVIAVIAIAIFVNLNSPKIEKAQIDYVKSVGNTYNSIANNTKSTIAAIDVNTLTMNDLPGIADTFDSMTKYNSNQESAMPVYGSDTKNLDTKFSTFNNSLNGYLKNANSIIQYSVAIKSFSDYIDQVNKISAVDFGSSSKTFDVSNRLDKTYDPVHTKLLSLYSSSNKLDAFFNNGVALTSDVHDELDTMYRDIRNAYYDKNDAQVQSIIDAHRVKISAILKKYNDTAGSSLSTIATDLQSVVTSDNDSFRTEYEAVVKNDNVKDAPTLVSKDSFSK